MRSNWKKSVHSIGSTLWDSVSTLWDYSIVRDYDSQVRRIETERLLIRQKLDLLEENKARVMVSALKIAKEYRNRNDDLKLQNVSQKMFELRKN